MSDDIFWLSQAWGWGLLLMRGGWDDAKQPAMHGIVLHLINNYPAPNMQQC